MHASMQCEVVAERAWESATRLRFVEDASLTYIVAMHSQLRRDDYVRFRSRHLNWTSKNPSHVCNRSRQASTCRLFADVFVMVDSLFVLVEEIEFCVDSCHSC